MKIGSTMNLPLIVPIIPSGKPDLSYQSGMVLGHAEK